MTCTGCRHEWMLRGKWMCALAERHGLRCTKWGKPKKEGKK